MRKISFKTIALFIALVMFLSCKKEEVSTSADSNKLPVKYIDSLELQYSSLNEAVYYVFKDWYLWNENIPSTIDYTKYSDATSLINAMKNSLDKWSFVISKAESDALFNEGEATGQGLDIWYDFKNEEYRICYVYPQSPAGDAGVYRGMIVDKVNGIPLEQLVQSESQFNTEFSKSTIDYTLIDTAGSSAIYSITNGTVKYQTVLHKEVKNIGGKNVGYIVFNSFLATSEAELTNAFSYFQGQNVSELVLDIRYNGGGYVYIAQLLASMIAGDKGKDKVFISEQFNKNYSKYNDTVKFEETPNKLDLDRVFIIGSRFTASASELVINGLKPHLTVILIGEKTHGKPVGFFPFTYKDTQIYPVSFQSVNSDGTGGYYDGIAPNIYKYDGVQYQFGDVREYCLKEALYYIENGVPSGTDVGARIANRDVKIPEKKGFQRIKGIY